MTRDDSRRIEEYEEKEKAWKAVCEEKGFKCSRCGNPPLLAERDDFFITDMCGPCYQVYRRDD